MPDPLIECVPNFSEGRNPAIVEAIVAAMAVDGVSLLDFSRDPDHNRSVVTIVGPPAAVVESAVRGAGPAGTGPPGPVRRPARGGQARGCQPSRCGRP